MIHPEVIREQATAALWRIEDLMLGGSTFEEAKSQAKRELKMTGFPSEDRNQVLDVVDTITLADFSSRARHEIFLSHREALRGTGQCGPVRWFLRKIARWRSPSSGSANAIQDRPN